MSCCAPKIGLARFAEHPGVILFAYLCALLPLAAIYALDFINKDWKSVRDTRRGGQLHLVFSLPPLAVVVFYIHLQRLDEDYKEMATAITAAILCILHVLRTVWGLVQLRAFKEWNMHSLRVLVRMGFDVPMYVSRDEAQIISDYEDHGRRGSFSSPDQNESLSSPVSKWLTNLVHIARGLLGRDKLEKVSVRNMYFCDGNGPTAKHIERTIDMRMVVNNSLVDNEFSGADLPCRPNFALLRHPIPKTGLRAADLLTCTKPEECAVRWTASFLARFASEWLIGATQPPVVKKSDTRGRDVWKRENLANRLAAYVACISTHTVNIKVESGEQSSQEVSILSPLHVMCSDLVLPWVPILKVTDKNCLPYQLRGRSESKEVQFENHTLCIQNCVSAWPTECLNELKGKEEKEAVRDMSPHHVAWFSKLIEEQGTHVLFRTRKMFPSYRTEKLKSFVWQLGYEYKPIERDYSTCTSQDILNDVCSSMPVRILSLELGVPFPLYDMLQASVHIDNWLALQASSFPVTSDDVQDELSEVEVQQYGQVFSEQRRLEMTRLQLQMASESGQDARVLGKIKFLGCVMETVRSSLAEELRKCQPGSDATSSDDWSPLITEESCTVVCSDQLYTALREADSGKASNADTTIDKFEQNALQMRVLWETQRALISRDGKGPGSPVSMVLCMLGYPSLRISKIDKCPPVYPSTERNTTEDVSIPVDDTGESDDEQSDPTESVEHPIPSIECLEEKRSCLRIDIVEAPQPLHITFQCTSESNKATVQIGVNEGHTETRFYWQRWKDGFMGRLCAQSNWRSTRLRQTNEMMRKEANTSKLTRGLSEFSRQGGTMRYWSGWPPFLSVITQFERRVALRAGRTRILSKAKLDKELEHFSGVQLDEISDSQGLETEINAPSPELECDCSCKGHELYLEAKELLDNGKEKQSLKLLRECILHHKHFLALEKYVSTLINRPNWYSTLHVLVCAMRDAAERTSLENTEANCRKCKQYDLESVIELLDNTFEKSGNDLVLYFKAQVLLLWSSDEYAVHERCIEALESLVLREEASRYLLTMSRIQLAMYFFQRYCTTGNQSDEEIGIQHCIRISDGGMDLGPDCMGIALLIEKGFVSIREFERIHRFFVHLNSPDLEQRMKNMFLRSNSNEHRMSRNTNAAFTMYSRLVEESKDHFGIASNRLALMYHRGGDGVSEDPERAEELYTAVWKRKLRLGPHSMCNLGVLYGQRNGSMENAEKSVKFFRNAIEEFEEKEKRRSDDKSFCGPPEKHSTSMNNLAVIMESGEILEKDVEQAKKLYLRAVEIDENPIAMYNLAVLFKFGDPSGENLEKAEELFSTVANLGVNLQSTPVLAAQLEKARLLAVTEPLKVFRYEVDEIDDCLAYVKVIDSSE